MRKMNTKPFDLYLYTTPVKGTYLSLIHANLSLIPELENIRDIYSRWSVMSYVQNYALPKAKAKHLQLMSILGMTAEHLLKVVLLKRGYVINRTDSDETPKFEAEFFKTICDFEPETQEDLDTLYHNASLHIVPKCNHEEKLLGFNKCKELFTEQENTYLRGIKTLQIKQVKYLGLYSELNSENCLEVIEKIRHLYVHRAGAYYETNGIPWYTYNFLLLIAKNEFGKAFEDLHFIGSGDVKQCFIT